MKKTIPKFNCYVNNTGHFFADTFFQMFFNVQKSILFQEIED